MVMNAGSGSSPLLRDPPLSRWANCFFHKFSHPRICGIKIVCMLLYEYRAPLVATKAERAPLKLPLFLPWVDYNILHVGTKGGIEDSRATITAYQEAPLYHIAS